MSHIPGRKEKDCLNCGTIVEGRYCQNCGQENVVPKETFWHMVTHFFYDITHFDSNFFHTLHHLILKPGFLSEEYMRGRRARYLHPIKMYVFSSAIFFLLFFSFFKPGDVKEPKKPEALAPTERASYIQSLQGRLKKDKDSKELQEKLTLALDSTRPLFAVDTVKRDDEQGLNISFGTKDYKTFAEYDSAEQLLSPEERDGWLTRRIVKRTIEINEKYKGDGKEAGRKLMDGLLHRLPYMLFVSLPLFALILKLVYIRRKQFYFADHGVFTIHLYVFSFLALLLVFLFDKLQELTGWTVWDIGQGFILLGLNVYLYAGMRKFYKQGWFKTFIKFVLVALLSLIMMMLLLAIFFIFSAATI